MTQIVLFHQRKQALKRIRVKEKHKQILQPSVKMQLIKEEGKDRKRGKEKKWLYKIATLKREKQTMLTKEGKQKTVHSLDKANVNEVRILT